MKNSNMIQILALTAIAGLSLIGCGAQKVTNGSGSTDFASSAYMANYSGQPIARCSHDVANFPNLGVRMMATQINQQYSQNASFYFRLKFDRFVDGFNTADQAIQVWTTSVDSMGNRRPPQRINFQLERVVGGAVQQASPYTYNDLTFSDMQSIGTANGFSVADGKDFFSTVSLLVFPDDQAQILTVTVYQTDGSGPTSQVELLIPQFYANPTDYALNHPQVLQQLHPLRDMVGGAWTAAQYENEANRFCF
ncbi:MAG: hypothetical protein BroJett040_24590 [Oligoflexia bacterium]|nr:MAG: hypothetical protein BroJett040_24590 [Oligoflexia bacterium]